MILIPKLERLERLERLDPTRQSLVLPSGSMKKRQNASADSEAGAKSTAANRHPRLFSERPVYDAFNNFNEKISRISMIAIIAMISLKKRFYYLNVPIISMISVLFSDLALGISSSSGAWNLDGWSFAATGRSFRKMCGLPNPPSTHNPSTNGCETFL